MKKFLHVVVLMLVLPPLVFAGQPPDCPPADTVNNYITVVDTVVVYDTVYVNEIDQAYEDVPLFDTYSGEIWGGGFKVTQPIFAPSDTTNTFDDHWKKKADFREKAWIVTGIIAVGLGAYILLSGSSGTTNVKRGTQCETCP